MKVVDVHTHMLNEAFVRLLKKHGKHYSVKKVVGGQMGIHRDGAPFMTLTPGMFDYEARIPNNVDLAGDRRLQRALESWQPKFSQWWHELVGGFAFTRDLSGMTLRGEGLWVGMSPADADREYQSNPGSGGSTTPPNDDDVVDAEIVDEDKSA